MKPYANQGIVTRKVGDYWITWNANLHSIGELNPQNSAAGETRQQSYNRFLDKFLFGRKDNPIFQRESTTIDYDEREPFFEIHSLRTRSGERNRGSARRTMNDFLKMVDEKKKDVRLYASPLDKRTRIGRLVEFYRDLGFEETGKKINALGHPEMMRYRKNHDDEPLTINYDQGNPRWLAEEREYAREKGYRHTAVGTRIPVHFGAVTAWTERDALIPVSWLADLPGLTGEERFTRQHDFDRLMQYMNKNNRLPPLSRDNNTQYSPFIQVWQNGNWYVSEGNHRIKVAKALGWKYMPVTIRWYSGAEEAIPKGMGYSIAEVMESDKRAHRAGYTVNDFRGIL